jgi:hypothetical protein
MRFCKSFHPANPASDNYVLANQPFVKKKRSGHTKEEGEQEKKTLLITGRTFG